MEHFRLFVLPFWLGALFLLVALLYKYILWFVKLEPAQRRMFFRSLPTRATLRSLGEIASESLLHRKIWRRNKLLGYMHTSFALGCTSTFSSRTTFTRFSNITSTFR